MISDIEKNLYEIRALKETLAYTVGKMPKQVLDTVVGYLRMSWEDTGELPTPREYAEMVHAAALSAHVPETPSSSATPNDGERLK